jgi:hypothetical protein
MSQDLPDHPPPGYTRCTAFYHPAGGENGFAGTVHTITADMPSNLSMLQLEARAQQAVGNRYTLAYVETHEETPPD